MTELKTKGSYAITGEMKANLADFAAGYATEEQVAKTIHDIYEDTGYVMDTHTAVAATVYKAYREDSKDDRKDSNSIHSKSIQICRKRYVSDRSEV